MRGVLITVEGVEGSGKSTQCRRLVESLLARGLDVVVTSEPDGTPMGAAIRRLFETDGPPPTPLTQVFLFMAARQQHVGEVIRPALSRGAVVISDRYTDATLAYQGFGQGVDLETIRDLNALATGGLLPDLTLLLDLDPAVGMSRIATGASTRSSGWIWRSTAACARAISRSRGPRSGGSSSSTPTSTEDALARADRGGGGRRLLQAGASRCRLTTPSPTISGQDEAVALLRRALAADRVAHAYAFVGPPGSGRKLAALAFAKALVAPSGRAAAARVERGAHPDVRLIQPTPPENNPKGPLALRIESVRALERLAALRPVEAPWKVFIVDEAERMTVATPQAFLKTLEEPPARTVIILILSQLRALPATVLSRCQIVRFRPRHADGTLALLPDGRDEARRRALRGAGRRGARGRRGHPRGRRRRWGATARRPRRSWRPAGSGTAISCAPRRAAGAQLRRVRRRRETSRLGSHSLQEAARRARRRAARRGRRFRAMSRRDSPSRCC